MSSASPPTRLHGGAERLPLRWANHAAPPLTISRYRVAPGDAVSLHVHTGKAEYWVIIAGSGLVTVGDDEIPVAEGDIVATPPAMPHGLVNTGRTPLVFINVVQPLGDEPITTTEVG